MTEYVGFKTGKEIEWLELNLLKNNRSFSKSEIINLADGVDEEDVDGWISEIEFRLSLYRNPIYLVKDNKITPQYTWQEVPEYFLCLYYSYFGANDYSGGTKLFEQISANALKNFIGGQSYTLGFPAGNGFNQYLKEIAFNCCEKNNMPAPGTYKDDGVDVVGYKLFGDARGSNLYILLQCAAGSHWTSKKPICLNRWTNYIIWFPDNIIQSISTVEYVSTKDWEKRTSTYGMLIDRMRIYNFLYKSEIDQELRTQVAEWVRIKLSGEI